MARFQAGQSGNLRGRPTDAVKARKIREQILKAAPEVVTRLIEAAKAGDVLAARSLLACACPPLKPAELPVTLTLPDDGLADQGRAVIAALASGQLALGQASQILAGLGAVAKLVETQELEARIAALEAVEIERP